MLKGGKRSIQVNIVGLVSFPADSMGSLSLLAEFGCDSKRCLKMGRKCNEDLSGWHKGGQTPKEQFGSKAASIGIGLVIGTDAFSSVVL